MLLEFQITEKPEPGNFHISTSASVIIICLICSPLDKLEQLRPSFFWPLSSFSWVHLPVKRLAQKHISDICWEKTCIVHCSPFRLHRRVWNSNQSQIYLLNFSARLRAAPPVMLAHQKRYKQEQKQKHENCSAYVCGTGRLGNRVLACMDMDRAAGLRKRAQQWLLIWGV